MLMISGTNITLTRGNTAELLVLPKNDDDTPYILASDDKVLFTVKNRVGKGLVQKTLTASAQDPETGEITIVLAPEDTIELAPQAYTYDVLLVTESGDAYTFIESSTFSVVSAIGTYKDVGGGGP